MLILNFIIVVGGTIGALSLLRRLARQDHSGEAEHAAAGDGRGTAAKLGRGRT